MKSPCEGDHPLSCFFISFFIICFFLKLFFLSFFHICFIAGIGVKLKLSMFPPQSVLHGDVVS